MHTGYIIYNEYSRGNSSSLYQLLFVYMLVIKEYINIFLKVVSKANTNNTIVYY